MVMKMFHINYLRGGISLMLNRGLESEIDNIKFACRRS